MSNGRDCPTCKKDIGLWPVFIAGWPTRVKCPHCKSVLRYDINVWRTFFVVVLPLAAALFASSLALMHRLFQESEMLPLVLSLALFTALWGIFELLTTRYLRRHKTLMIVKEGSNNH